MDKPQLLEAINKLPDNIRFLSPKDDEGNGYRWLSGVSVDYIRNEDLEEYEPEGVLSEDDVKDDYSEEEIEELLTPVAVLW
jgi:hypothetical protein